MPLAIDSVTSVPQKNQQPASTSTRSSNPPLYAVEEINAYIAIRDELLSEAEKLRTGAKIDSVLIANNFVAGCLKPGRSPYEAQCLPEVEARRERERCEVVTHRVAELRATAA